MRLGTSGSMLVDPGVFAFMPTALWATMQRHTVVLLLDRQEQPLRYGAPERLTLDHAAVRQAASELGIRLSS